MPDSSWHQKVYIEIQVDSDRAQDFKLSEYQYGLILQYSTVAGGEVHPIAIYHPLIDAEFNRPLKDLGADWFRDRLEKERGYDNSALDKTLIRTSVFAIEPEKLSRAGLHSGRLEQIYVYLASRALAEFSPELKLKIRVLYSNEECFIECSGLLLAVGVLSRHPNFKGQTFQNSSLYKSSEEICRKIESISLSPPEIQLLEAHSFIEDSNGPKNAPEPTAACVEQDCKENNCRYPFSITSIVAWFCLTLSIVWWIYEYKDFSLPKPPLDVTTIPKYQAKIPGQGFSLVQKPEVVIKRPIKYHQNIGSISSCGGELRCRELCPSGNYECVKHKFPELTKLRQ